MSVPAPASHRFTVGAVECAVVADGTNMYETRSVLGDVPADQMEAALREYHLDPNELCVDYTALLITTSRGRALVDTGVGATGGDPPPTYGRLLANLRGLGVAPEEIDLVILTHIHPDHIGGVIDAQARPTFPKARYLLARAEWEFWMEEPDLTGVTQPEEMRASFTSFARAHLTAIKERISLVSPGMEIIPGVRAIAAPGHTPGHLALEVASGDQRLLVIGDAALSPFHLEHPEWTAAVDTRAAQTVATRRELFARAVFDNALVQANHFPFPGLGRITRPDGAWRWNPI